jgi:hypothetical protein
MDFHEGQERQDLKILNFRENNGGNEKCEE